MAQQDAARTFNMRYVATPFGMILIAATAHSLCWLGFTNPKTISNPSCVAIIRRRASGAMTPTFALTRIACLHSLRAGPPISNSRSMSERHRSNPRYGVSCAEFRLARRDLMARSRAKSAAPVLRARSASANLGRNPVRDHRVPCHRVIGALPGP